MINSDFIVILFFCVLLTLSFIIKWAFSLFIFVLQDCLLFFCAVFSFLIVDCSLIHYRRYLSFLFTYLFLFCLFEDVILVLFNGLLHLVFTLLVKLIYPSSLRSLLMISYLVLKIFCLLSADNIFS